MSPTILLLVVLCLSNLSLFHAQAPFTLKSAHFLQVYDPSVGEDQKWYINDHTFVQDQKGTWHIFGITHQEPLDPSNEKNFAHATAPTITGPWTKQPFALTYDPNYYNETFLWAPHVINVDGVYHMFYAGGGPDASHWKINLATSTDLFNWTRNPGGPLFYDGQGARDPMVINIDGMWHIYYCATIQQTGGNNIVGHRTSNDLIHWSDRQVALNDPTNSTSPNTESPFVVHRDGVYYLFTGPNEGYVGTTIFWSKDPTNFSYDKVAGHIFSHAAEVIQDSDRWWISHAGWGQGGVYLAPLYWQ